MIFENFFPTIIAYDYNLNHKFIEKKLVSCCFSIKEKTRSGGNGWISNNTYNTSNGVYNIVSDDNFKILNDWVFESVDRYAKDTFISGNLETTEAWFNIYSKYDYQEFHKHPFNSLSAIYILSAPKSSSKIFFKNPADDIFEIVRTEHNIKTCQTVFYNSEPGKLIIFPSNISHSVEQHLSDDVRITLSYNFRQVI